MAPKLRHHNVAGEIKGSQSSKSNEWIHKILAVSSAKALYLALVQEWATILCFPNF
jgi:hypothetical protein